MFMSNSILLLLLWVILYVWEYTWVYEISDREEHSSLKRNEKIEVLEEETGESGLGQEHAEVKDTGEEVEVVAEQEGVWGQGGERVNHKDSQNGVLQEGWQGVHKEVTLVFLENFFWLGLNKYWRIRFISQSTFKYYYIFNDRFTRI